MTNVYELLGELGSGLSDPIPVYAVAAGGNGSKEVIHTVSVPSGETWMVIMLGDLTPVYRNSSNSPSLLLGSSSSGRYLDAAQYGMVTTSTGGSVTAAIKRGISTGEDIFDGNIYTIKL